MVLYDLFILIANITRIENQYLKAFYFLFFPVKSRSINLSCIEDIRCMVLERDQLPLVFMSSIFCLYTLDNLIIFQVSKESNC